MSNQQIFDDIMNQFDSEDEEDIEEEDDIKNNDKIMKHKFSSSLGGNSNNKIKEALSNIEYEENQNNNKRKFKKDQFGYFINNNDDNNEQNEEVNSYNEEFEQDSYNYNCNEYSEKRKKENVIDNEQKEMIDKKLNFIEEEIENHNNEYNEERNSNYNNNEENNNNEIVENNIINNNNEDKVDIYEKICNENDGDLDLINDFDRNKNGNLDSMEEGFRFMDSFRPIPTPSSPKFNKRVSVNNNDELKNNNINNNNNARISCFAETIKTKIEGENSIKNPNIDLQNNSNNLKNIYTHNNNFISLGKLPNKDIINSYYLNNINDKIEESNNRNIDDEEKEEDEFLKGEELKIKKKREKKKLEKEKSENIFKKESEDEGKENVTGDEEDENKINEIINNDNKEKLKEDITDDEEDNDINKNININKFQNQDSNNDLNDNKVRDISIKLMQEYSKAGDSQKSSIRQSEKNSIYFNNDSICNIESQSSIRNNNENSKKMLSNEDKNNLNQNPLTKKDSKHNSPSTKNTKYNNTNYSSRYRKQVNSTINKNNTSFKINSNHSKNESYFSKKNKMENKSDLQSIKRNLYYPKHEIKSKLFEKKTCKKVSYTPEKYTFTPYINQNSRKICEKKKRRALTFDINSKNENNSYISSRKPNIPIGILLYEDASNKREKINKLYNNESNNIKLNANIKKMNLNSYNMIINRTHKKIDNAIKKYSSDGLLSIVGLTQCLFELNVINELIKIKDNIDEGNNDLDFVELQSIIEYLNEKDIKKLQEVELLEQLWFLINPSLSNNINNEILSELLKILLSSNNNIKDLTNYIEKILNKYNINNKNNEDNENKTYLSPLRNKKYNKNELWSLTKFIKIFLSLKQNLKAYRSNDYQKNIYNNIIKERQKDLTFKPNLTSRNFFNKYSKYDYDKDNSNDLVNLSNTENNTSKKSKYDFNKTYKRFMAEKELHEKTLEKIRQKKTEKELKNCRFKPKINKFKIKSPDKRNTNINKSIDSQNSKILTKSHSTIDVIKHPKYQKIYNKKKINKINKTIENENCTFKPMLNTNNENLKKTFLKMEKIKKPKGYCDYIKRNRAIIERKESQKKYQEDKIYGKNYEKIKNMKIKPFNITDLNGNKKKNNKINKTNISISSSPYDKSTIDQNNNTNINKLENKKIEKVIEDIFFTINIKIPNGQLKPLKINKKNYNDTIELVNNFCKIYSINNENKEAILKKINQYKNSFFSRNINEVNNKEGFLFKEDLDSFTSNNSNH